MTCSIGVTSVTDSDDFNSTFDRMDKALYAAKSAGRNCVRSVL
ncbi:GGDEF domain-containing protein [Ruminococcus flavefaciens]